MWHTQLQGRGVRFLFFLKLVLIFFVAFDRDFLVVEIFFLRCKWVDFIYRWCFGLLHLVVFLK